MITFIYGYIEFDYVRISLTREKYWYEIRDVLVPILHTVLGIGTNFSRREIYVVVNYRFNKTVRKLCRFICFRLQLKIASFIVKDKPAQPMNKVSIQEISCVDTTTA